MIPLLEVKKVSYAYHTPSGETCALTDISFRVDKGEFAAVVGPSGCGKSTLLSLLAGLLVPECGEVLLEGEKPKQKREKIGYMLQRDELLPWRTIERNVMLGPEIRHQEDETVRLRVDNMLKDYGLYRFRSALPHELSGGMRQRAALIRTLAADPELLLLDEPFSALDYQTRLKVCDDMAAIIKKENRTAVLVTHDLSEAVSMADRVLVLTRRPAHICAEVEVRFRKENLTPFERRNEPEFRDCFNRIWGALNGTESAKKEAGTNA